MLRSGHTDDRRRRVLTEEVVGGAAGRATAAARPEAAARPYSDAANLENHRRVSDLVPRRLSVVALLGFLAAAAIGGLLGLHHVSARSMGFQPVSTVSASNTGWEAHATHTASAIDLLQNGSMASWLSSMLLMGAAAAALLVYSLRKHKQSDYHGRYRVWLWTALSAVGMSLCSTAPVHEVLAAQIAARTRWQLPGGMLLMWLIPLGLVLFVLGLRLLLEVRSSKLALATLLLAVAAHVAGLVVLHSGKVALPPAAAAMSGVGCQLSANLLLLVGITLFARHVLLDIEGRIPQREKPAAKPAPDAPAKKGAADDLGGTTLRKTDAPHATPPAPAAKSDTAAEMAASRRRREEAEEEQQWYESNRDDRHRHGRNDRDESDDYSSSDSDEDAPTHRKLSKAERKRLRRLKAQQRENEFN